MQAQIPAPIAKWSFEETGEAKIEVADNEAIDFKTEESFSVSGLVFGDLVINAGGEENGKWLVQKGVIPSGDGNRGKWFGIELKYYTESYQIRFAVDDNTTNKKH